MLPPLIASVNRASLLPASFNGRQAPMGQPDTMIPQAPAEQPMMPAPQEVQQERPSLLRRMFNPVAGLFKNDISINNAQANMGQQFIGSEPKPTKSPFEAKPIPGPTAQPVQQKTYYDPNIFKVQPRENSKLLAVLVAEAGNEGVAGMQGVLNTIINRTQVNPKYYGKDVWNVISKPAQYTGFSVSDPNYKEVLDYLDKKRSKVTPGREQQIAQARQLLQLAQEGRLQDITDGSTHYYNPKKAAHYPWMDVAEFKKDIGEHKFVYLYK